MKLDGRNAVAAVLCAVSVISAAAFAGEPAKPEATRAQATQAVPAKAEPKKAEAASTQTVALRVEKMVCASCAQKVTDALAALEGVKSAKVDFRAHGATVEFNPAKVSPEQLVKTVTTAGFEASLPPGA